MLGISAPKQHEVVGYCLLRHEEITVPPREIVSTPFWDQRLDILVGFAFGRFVCILHRTYYVLAHSFKTSSCDPSPLHTPRSVPRASSVRSLPCRRGEERRELQSCNLSACSPRTDGALGWMVRKHWHPIDPITEATIFEEAFLR